MTNSEELGNELLEWLDERMQAEGLEEAEGFAALCVTFASYITRTVNPNHTTESAIELVLTSTSCIAQLALPRVFETIKQLKH